MKRKVLATICAVLSVPALWADLAGGDPEQLAADLAHAEESYQKGDIPALLTLLSKDDLFVQKDVALKLGRLGAKDALAKIRQLDQQYSEYACSPSGQFGVAAILLESPDKAQQRDALLEVATDDWENQKYALSVIDQAGRELNRYDEATIVERLKEVNTYGAQFTVLTLQCRNLSPKDVIAKCVYALEQSVTPQQAEAAQELLIASGKLAIDPVQKLKERLKVKNDALGLQHTMSRSVEYRCGDILNSLLAQDLGDELRR